MTHHELVERGARWLRNTKRCRVVLMEIVTSVSETPDVIGWKGALTTLVECKTSRSDFLRDKHKSFRINRDKGMGFRRYYLTPPGLLTLEDLPEMWGLIEANTRCIRVRRQSSQFRNRNTRAEVILLQSELALYQQVLTGGELFRTGRAERIYIDLGRIPPWQSYWYGAGI